ncbi:hypothetical protein [Pontibacillus salipaludis]|uniref:Uncharacterized protein n=1 Tax=Pontibacillus salipaludis TaxID=1697394 RepID=A0ABQ1PYR0_9BACI|nr:hypothetical protein [Pontibacillus salipaludis]GGD07839.1 hypothetical protein GCM10011389_14210 [Pontibacillus salipaludis]
MKKFKWICSYEGDRQLFERRKGLLQRLDREESKDEDVALFELVETEKALVEGYIHRLCLPEHVERAVKTAVKDAPEIYSEYLDLAIADVYKEVI